MIRSIAARLGFFAVGLFGMGFATPVLAQPAQRLVCESIDYQPRMCAQPGLTDAFVVQLLGGECVAGQQWNWGPKGISVRNGCRAVFGFRTAGYGGGNYPPPPPPPSAPVYGGNPGYGRPGQPVLCASMNFQPARCPMDTSRGVTIGMITNQPCRQGQTWGWDRGGVWVTGNCRAYFRATGGGGIGTGAGSPGGGYPGGGYPGGNAGSNPGIGNDAGIAGQIVECSSWQYRPARCAANTRNGVQLVAVIGGECIRNRSWGWDQNAIWVSDGCRARFRTN